MRMGKLVLKAAPKKACSADFIRSACDRL